MLAYQAASGSGAQRHLGPLQVAGVRMTLTMLSAVDYIDLLAVIRTGEEADKLDAEAKQSLDELARLPALVAVSMVDPYIRGAFLGVGGLGARWLAARRAALPRAAPIDRAGAASDREAARPARSTDRDPPAGGGVAGGAGARIAATEPVLQETAGELDWRCYFGNLGAIPIPTGAADGLGGDR